MRKYSALFPYVRDQDTIIPQFIQLSQSNFKIVSSNGSPDIRTALFHFILINFILFSFTLFDLYKALGGLMFKMGGKS